MAQVRSTSRRFSAVRLAGFDELGTRGEHDGLPYWPKHSRSFSQLHSARRVKPPSTTPPVRPITKTWTARASGCGIEADGRLT